MRRHRLHRFGATVLAICAGVVFSVMPTQANAQKPNILVIWGDDIGYWNVSAYNQGMMGYKTPHIDRIAREGALFTDWYGQQSCTAGRTAFITGQSPFRTGLLKVGLPGAKEVMYSTDNGAEKFTWPDGGTSPFRGEKNTNWEGGYRVPTAIRWPGVIRPGTVLNDIFAHEDMLPTIMAAAGVPDVKEQLRKGMQVGNKTFKVHLDGYNLTDALAGKGPSPRHEFFYFNDDGSIVGLRYDQWKIVFAEQNAHGADVWRQPFTTLRAPKIFNLRSDPFEIGDHEAMDWNRWWVEHVFLFVPAQQYVGQFIATFKEFPPSQKPGSFSLDTVLRALETPGGN